MSTAQTLILGAVAGFTIYVGLPLGRIRSTHPALRASLGAVATGILVFLFWDVVSHGVDPVDARLQAHRWGPFAGYATLLGLGFAAGLMSLVYYDAWLKSRRATPLVGPGAAAVDEFRHRSWFEALTPGRRLALLSATGIGLHNFGEGLAIGQASAAGELSLALGLIIGGVPTSLGTLIGQAWVRTALETVFFAVAGGSILYVVIQLFEVCRRFALPTLVAWMILLGLLLGFGTDFV